MGLGDTGRLQVTATAPYGTEGIWYLNITVAGPSVSSSISTGKALKNLADKIRQLKAGAVDYWIQYVLYALSLQPIVLCQRDRFLFLY